MSEVATAGVSPQESLKEQIIFSSENCFNIIPSGVIPPDTTPKLDVNRAVAKQEELYAKNALEAPKQWQFFVEECGLDIVRRAAELGVTIKDIEKFYPHFVQKDKSKDLGIEIETNGFSNGLSRRPVVFVDNTSQDLSLETIATIYHEMVHSVSRKTIFVSYDDSGNHTIRFNQGLTAIAHQNFEEYVAHSETMNYMNNESLFASTIKRHLADLAKKTGLQSYPMLNEISIPVSNGQVQLVDAVGASKEAKKGKVTYSKSNLADDFVDTILDDLPEEDRKKTEFFLKKSRFAPNYRLSNEALTIIVNHWGRDVFDNIIEKTEYTPEAIAQAIDLLQKAKDSRDASKNIQLENFPDSLTELVKQLDTAPPGKQ